MPSNYETKDSGTRETFPSGAVRDQREGKGRYDLLSAGAIRRIAGVFERGAKKYAARNWEAGMPASRCVDSALRHIFQYLEGFKDEDHLAQAAWNLCAVMHFEEKNRVDLLDIPGQGGYSKETQAEGISGISGQASQEVGRQFHTVLNARESSLSALQLHPSQR